MPLDLSNGSLLHGYTSNAIHTELLLSRVAAERGNQISLGTVHIYVDNNQHLDGNYLHFKMLTNDTGSFVLHSRSYINNRLCHSKPCIYAVHLTVSELPGAQTRRSDKDRRQASISSKRPIFLAGS